MNRYLLPLKITLASLAFFAVTTSTAGAQGVPSSVQNPLVLSASPDEPSPGQAVTVTAQSYLFNIDSANMTWSAGGKVIAKGIGLTGQIVQAPAIGKKLTVTVTAVTPDGSPYRNSTVISSGSVDLIIEPDGYTPPFFLGKWPVAYQNAIKITAMPHIANASGVEYDPSQLVYKWEKNFIALPDQSGYGRQSIVIPGDIIYRPYPIMVIVTSRDGSAQAAGLVPVTAGSPNITFYQNDPMYGPLFNNAIGDTLSLGTQQEAGVLAVPFGFNIPASGIGSLNLSWLINSREHNELAANDTVTLRAPDSNGGSSSVELNMTSNGNILQQAQAGFSVAWSAGTKSSAQSGVTF